MVERRRSKNISIPGVILTVLATLGFIWAAVQWYNRYDWPPELTTDDIKANEVQAFENLKLIAQAQEKYRERDWDGDGARTYAKFLPHLWTDVGKENEQILIELIPRALAFAMGSTEAVAGYYFEDLHSRALRERGRHRKLDYEREWAAAAVPATFWRTGFLVFLADSSGAIFARDSREVPARYPHDPTSEEWTRIDSVQQLQGLQNTVDYSRKAVRYDAPRGRR